MVGDAGNDDSQLVPADDTQATPAAVPSEDAVQLELQENVMEQLISYQSTEKHLCGLINKK